MNEPDFQDQKIDYLRWFLRFRKHWKWILASAILGISLSWLYYQKATKIYEFHATIMLKGTPSQLNIFDRNFATTAAMSTFRSEYMGYLNQSIKLGLPSSVRRTVESLNFATPVYAKTRFNRVDLYPNEPYTILIDSTKLQGLGVEFEIREGEKGRLTLEAKGNKVLLHDYKAGKSVSRYGVVDETIVVPADGWVRREYAAFRITKNNQKTDDSAMTTQSSQGLPVFFRFFSAHQLTRHFASMNVKEVEKYATSATVTLRTIYKEKGKVFLDQHLNRWLEEELQEKTLTAVNTLRFINQQLDITRDSLNVIKGRIERFRREKDVILLEQQLGDLYSNRKLAEEELVQLKLSRDRLTDLRLYIGQREANAELIVPVVTELNSEVLASAVLQLIETRSLLHGLREKEKNPYILNLEKEERTQLALVKEAIAELMRYTANEIRITEKRLQGYVAEQFALQAMEQEYLELKRVFDLNDKMYNLLRTRKVETEVMKAAATPDSRVLEYASDGVQVAPKKYILLAGVLGGLAVPVAIIMVMGLMDVKINDDEDVHRLTTHPILGHILRNDQNQPLVTYDYPAIPLTETFRALRSSFNYVLQGEPAQLIVVTSSNAGEGKSFCAMNLAGLYAMAGKRTVLLGFDLRKHGLNNYLDVHRKPGITEVLIGHKTLEEVTMNYRPNLDIVFAGTTPPNPSDLIESEATRELISTLRGRYDYIIVDTSPAGLVTDALPLAQLADLNLYVVRPGVSLKKVLEPTLHQLEKSGVKRIGIVMNAVNPAERHVSYGYGYTAASEA